MKSKNAMIVTVFVFLLICFSGAAFAQKVSRISSNLGKGHFFRIDIASPEYDAIKLHKQIYSILSKTLTTGKVKRAGLIHVVTKDVCSFDTSLKEAKKIFPLIGNNKAVFQCSRNQARFL